MLDDDVMRSMCVGFNKVFYCVNNEEYVLVDADYHQGENWYVPKFLTKTKFPQGRGYCLSYIYSLYPQDGTREEQFMNFYRKVDGTIRQCVLKSIMENYNNENMLPDEQ